MSDEDLGAGETAIKYADAFVDAAVAKLDAVFGDGYAKANPRTFAAYVAACAGNLNSFMIATTQALGDGMAAALAEFEQMDDPEPEPPRSRSKSRKTR